METSKVRVLLMALRKTHRAKVCQRLEAEKIRRHEQDQEDRLRYDSEIELMIEAKVAQALRRLDKQP